MRSASYRRGCTTDVRMKRSMPSLHAARRSDRMDFGECERPHAGGPHESQMGERHMQPPDPCSVFTFNGRSSTPSHGGCHAAIRQVPAA
ncbi:hypothetical protein EMIT0111MI5_10723 [Burkholderia sp. IT-111MI5]